MRQNLLYVSFLLLTFHINLYAQSSGSVSADNYSLGMKALSEKDTAAAEIFFKKSIRDYRDSKSLYQLAKIYFHINTVTKRVEARSLLNDAILKEPGNIQYKFLMAEILERESSGLSYDIYKQILKLDSTSAKALYNMGRIKEEDFADLHNSVYQTEPYAPLSFEKFAQEDYRTAESYLLKSLRFDSLNREAYLHISFLYEDDGKPEKGIPFLEKLQKIYTEDMEAHLYLGLLFYESHKIENALKEYQKALSLMSEEERNDFTFNSVKELLKPIFGDNFKKYTDDELKKIINYFWKINDPLYLTDYNERLLEHYSRVAYANLRYSIKDKNHPGSPPLQSGWKTDRGEVILRYGQPLLRTRYRAYISSGGRTQINMSTDVWEYKNFTFGFTDQFMNGKYVFSEPLPGSMYIPQFGGDTPMLIEYLRKAQFNGYTPAFDGPVFDVPYNIVQLKSEKYNYTDVYVNYGLYAADSIKKGSEFIYPHKWGLFFFDSVFNPVVRKEGVIDQFPTDREINLPGGKNLLINSLEMTVYPDSGNMAFEIERKSDKGVSTNHFRFTPEKFEPYKLGISDIVLASRIAENSAQAYSMQRGNVSILPNPTHIFYPNQTIYIYYELYNLKQDSTGICSYEQKLILEKEDKSSFIGGAFNSFLNIFGLGREENRVVVTANYQSHHKSPRTYFQFDMNSYPAGNYILTLIIKDKLSGKEVNTKTFIYYK